MTPVDVSTSFGNSSTTSRKRRGKSNLNIGVTRTRSGSNRHGRTSTSITCSSTGVREFIERDDGIDYYIDYTPTTRTYFQFAASGAPTGTCRSRSSSGRATTRPTVSTTTFDRRCGACITHETMLGEDNGADREQGDYSDTSNTAGIVLEDVRQAPQGRRSTVASRSHATS
jgi:hypothetical protein